MLSILSQFNWGVQCNPVPSLWPRTRSLCFDLLWPVRAGLAGPVGCSWPQDFWGIPVLAVPPLRGPPWPLAAAPPWPPLSVADSTTQWLPLLKQSRFLPLASTPSRLFRVLSVCARFPPHGQRTFQLQPRLLEQTLPRGVGGCGLARRAALLHSLQWHRAPSASPRSCRSRGSVPQHSAPAHGCLAKRATLKPIKECQF